MSVVLPAAADGPVAIRLTADGMISQSPVDDLVRAVREGRRRRLIVLAPRATAAASFAEEHGLPRRQVVYGTPRSVRGWTADAVVVLPGWQDSREAEQTWIAAVPMFACAAVQESPSRR